ncbi:polycomb group RING finger protein 6-like isoform X2 [Ptychodera flava]
MQDVVHKLLPQVEEEERRRQEEFYKRSGLSLPHHEPTPETTPKPRVERMEENIVSLVLEFIGSSKELGEPIKALEKKFVRVTSKATVRHVQRFLCKKLQLSDMFEVDVISNDEIMEPEVTLDMMVPMARKLDGLIVLNYVVALREGAGMLRQK